MPTILTRYLAFICLSISGASLHAEEKSEWNFLGGATMAYKNINFEIPAGGVAFSPELMMYNMSGTLSYGRFFTTVNYDQTVRDDTQYGPGNSSLILMSRDDMDISAGVYVGAGISLFGGYKDGTLHADVTNETTGGPGCPGGLPICPVDPYEVEFRDKGPFVGVSYTASLPASTLSFNVAYAAMDGEVSFKSGASETSGDTTGFSYSVSWNIPITESTTFTAKANAVRYDFEDTEMGTINGSGNPQDMGYEQTFDILSFTISHFF